MIKRLLLIICLAIAVTQAHADAESVRDRIIGILKNDGYSEIRIKRTLLGRVRFVATKRDSKREIVANPVTGLILRDYVWLLLTEDQQVPGPSGQVEEQEEEEDDEEDGEDNSGHGGGDDDDDHDNSGPGNSDDD